MRILVLTPYRYGVAPGPRSSIELWEKVAADAGIEFVYSPFETDRLASVIYEQGHFGAKAVALVDAYRKRVLDLDAVDEADAVLIYREAALVGPAWIERYVARKKPVIYQLDDPLYVPYRSPFSGFFSYLKFFGKVGSICKLSTVTVVNSKQHYAYAAEHGAKRLYEIPCLVDADDYFPRQKIEKDRLRIGWTGSASTVQNLAMIEEPLRSVVSQTDADVQVIGADDTPLSGFRVDAKPWSAETEVEDVSQFDIGLLPIPHTPWNERKFFMKLSQYMTLGVPAVATPMGAVAETMEDGKTGFIARTNQDWEERLLQLAQDSELRERMAKRSAEVGASKYTVQANADLIVEALQAAVR